MIRGLRVAWVLTLCGLLVASYYLMDSTWWIRVLVGAAATAPLLLADTIVSRRARQTSTKSRRTSP